MKRFSLFGHSGKSDNSVIDSPIKSLLGVGAINPPGKHVIVLGNGFDIHLNRPTNYSQFYNSEFCPKSYPAPLINYLNGFSKDGKADYLRWYDFENELLNYHKSKEFMKDSLSYEETRVLNYLLQSKPEPLEMQDFLFQIQGRGDFDAFLPFLEKGFIKPVEKGKKYILTFDKLNTNIITRDLYALSLIKNGLIAYLNSMINDEIGDVKYPLTLLKEKDIEVYTFNYTSVPLVDIKNVHYVHGSCVDGNIIIGTREEDVLKEYRFLQKVFDPEYRPSYVSYALLNAERVTIFGHSLGINDRQYFQAFFKRQCDADKAKKRMQIDIFTKDDASAMEIKRSLQELTEFHLSDLYQYSTLKIISTDSL